MSIDTVDVGATYALDTCPNGAHDILRIEVGSTAHGTGLHGHEDLDEMAITIPHRDVVLGLGDWEHDIIRIDRATGSRLDQHTRSTPDTYELTRYSLRKWMNLAVTGNPSILLAMFAPVRQASDWGLLLRSTDTVRAIVSERAIPRFAGYMRSQALRLVGEKGSGHGRRGGGKREDVTGAGYDTKYAMHMLRLGFQGIELMTTGRISLPMSGHDGEFCRAVRRGEVPFAEAFGQAVRLHAVLESMRGRALVPARPDMRYVNDFLADAHLWTWGVQRR